MNENNKSRTKILLTIVVLLSFSLFATEYKNSIAIEKLKADNTALRSEISNKDNQLKSEQSKAEDFNRSFWEESPTSDTIQTIAKPQQIRYRYRRHYSVRRKRVMRRYSVSRGGPRVDVEPIIREVGAGYWSDPAELDALVWICSHECTTPGRVNPRGFYGLFQLSNPPAWMVLGDAASETKAGCEYILRRYGSPLAAKAWWVNHHWY